MCFFYAGCNDSEQLLRINGNVRMWVLPWGNMDTTRHNNDHQYHKAREQGNRCECFHLRRFTWWYDCGWACLIYAKLLWSRLAHWTYWIYFGHTCWIGISCKHTILLFGRCSLQEIQTVGNWERRIIILIDMNLNYRKDRIKIWNENYLFYHLINYTRYLSNFNYI